MERAIRKGLRRLLGRLRGVILHFPSKGLQERTTACRFGGTPNGLGAEGGSAKKPSDFWTSVGEAGFGVPQPRNLGRRRVEFPGP